MTETTNLTVACPHCGNTGNGYTDEENFEKKDYGHHGRATHCLACHREF